MTFEQGPDPSSESAGSTRWRPIGRLQGIFLSKGSLQPMVEVPRTVAVAGMGLIGDRYSTGQGTWSREGLWSEATFIRSEVVKELNESGFVLNPRMLRRNLLTESVELSQLVGKDFRVGEAVLHGDRPCLPCRFLERSLDSPGLKAKLAELGGGLRATILADGIIDSDSIICVKENETI